MENCLNRLEFFEPFEHLPVKEDVLRFIDKIREDYFLWGCPENREPYNCLGNAKIAERFLGQVWRSKEAKADPRDPYTGHEVALVELEKQGLCLIDITSHNPILEIPDNLKKFSFEEMLKFITHYGSWRLIASYKKAIAK